MCRISSVSFCPHCFADDVDGTTGGMADFSLS